jgi:hypothetical protein
MRKIWNFILRFAICAVIIIIAKFVFPPFILLFTDDTIIATLIALPLYFLIGILTFKFNPFIDKEELWKNDEKRRVRNEDKNTNKSEQPFYPHPTNTKGIILWFFLVTSAIVAVMLGINSKLTENKFNQLNKHQALVESLLNEKTSKIRELENKLQDIGTVFPLIIKSLKIANTYQNGSIETDYGNQIYSSTSMYLKPQIEYIALTPNQTITLYQKLYKNGELSRGTASPDGYSTQSKININSKGKVGLTGWGNEIMGHWPAGNYRFEIWYNDVCLKAINFTIY